MYNSGFCKKPIARQNKHDPMSWMLPNLCQLQQRSLLEAEWINKSWASSSINRITILLIFMLWIVRIPNWSDFTFLYWLISFSQPEIVQGLKHMRGSSFKLLSQTSFSHPWHTTPSLQQKLHWLVTTKAPVHVVRAQEVCDLLPHVST